MLPLPTRARGKILCEGLATIPVFSGVERRFWVRPGRTRTRWHNYCEVHNKTVNEQSMNAALQYDMDFQPPSRATNLRTGNNETEGKLPNDLTYNVVKL